MLNNNQEEQQRKELEEKNWNKNYYDYIKNQNQSLNNNFYSKDNFFSSLIFSKLEKDEKIDNLNEHFMKILKNKKNSITSSITFFHNILLITLCNAFYICMFLINIIFIYNKLEKQRIYSTYNRVGGQREPDIDPSFLYKLLIIDLTMSSAFMWIILYFNKKRTKTVFSNLISKSIIEENRN